jgi:hypothetical protein
MKEEEMGDGWVLDLELVFIEVVGEDFIGGLWAEECLYKYLFKI